MGYDSGTAEHRRLAEAEAGRADWHRWGTYVSDRAWGTVREDYSPDGDAWRYFPHDHARSRTYRWGEDGIGGFCDHAQILCLAAAFWNGRDPILKERMFGLTNEEGNHGEDVKEHYFYLDNTPTHSYARMLYKYPQVAFPYERQVEENARRSQREPEFELFDAIGDMFRAGRHQTGWTALVAVLLRYGGSCISTAHGMRGRGNRSPRERADEETSPCVRQQPRQRPSRQRSRPKAHEPCICTGCRCDTALDPFPAEP